MAGKEISGPAFFMWRGEGRKKDTPAVKYHQGFYKFLYLLESPNPAFSATRLMASPVFRYSRLRSIRYS